MSLGKVVGKRVAQRVYLHVSAIEESRTDYLEALSEAEKTSGISRGVDFNVVRFESDSNRVTLLNYPNFFDEPFPALQDSWKTDIGEDTFTYRTYVDSFNPPILHRKELLISPDNPRWTEYAEFTKAAEDIGLFDKPTRIGFQRQWEDLVHERGYQINGHQFVPYGNEEQDTQEGFTFHDGWQAARHLTALVRYGLSAPFQTLARYGFLDGRHSIFDYGCGRGDDLRGLSDNDLKASGWDPYYAPENPIHSADLVNLGFVVNVIEDFEERIEALKGAWECAERLLVVSVMLENLNRSKGRKFRDGVLSTRNTFQKYYSQNEIREFVQEVLDVEPIPVAPGIIYVFRDKELEQSFLLKRYSRNRNYSNRRRFSIPLTPRISQREKQEKFYAEHRNLLDPLWTQWQKLGRRPEVSEVQNLASIEELFSSLKRTLNFLERFNGPEEVDRAFTARTQDLEVYFALGIFERRSPYKVVSPRIRYDIKAFFGSFREAKTSAAELLYKIANSQLIDEACNVAKQHGLGWLEPGESLQLHSSMVENLPPILRVYVGCASVLYGDYRASDLVKIHIHTGKLSLMKFDDFEGSPLPRMIERIKINYRENDIGFFDYVDDFEPPILFNKSRYINEEFPKYPEQVSFEEELEQLAIFDLSRFGPRPKEFEDCLTKHRWLIDGFKLIRQKEIPDLDDECGGHFTYREIIECGETFGKSNIPNLPNNPETYSAMFDLAINILDPVIDYFGMIKLTYGFCSSELARQIPGKIAPKLDQHASCEINKNGNYICDRLGAAVDFIVEDEDMLEVAQWITANAPFDRLYFYGPDKPIHVSYGPEKKREIVIMSPSKGGRLIPKVVKSESFVAMPL